MYKPCITLIFCTLFSTEYAHADDINMLNQKANIAAEQEFFEEAIALYTECYSMNFHDVQSMFSAAICLLKIGRITESITLLNSICSLVKNPLPIRYNIAYAYKTAGMIDTAIALYRDIIAQNPEYEDAHLGLGFAYLQNGDFVNGWHQHSRYLKKAGKNSDELRALLHNNDLVNKKILLAYEGGLGDTLLFIRYVERIKNLGAQTICLVQKPLIPLLSRCPYIDRLLPYQHPVPEHDARATLMSLPAIFEDTEDRFTVSIPYLYPDQALVNTWKERLAQYDTIKIGITWQSDVHNDVSRLPIARRGIPLALFEPLLKDERFTFFSLQCFEGTEQIAHLSPDCRLVTYADLDTKHGCFMDTAAIIQNLDLVIAVDSAVANISGALGIPTILLLPYVTDWRWIANRKDSPWYPEHIIFKQPQPFDWESTVHEVGTYLESLFFKKG